MCLFSLIEQKIKRQFNPEAAQTHLVVDFPETDLLLGKLFPEDSLQNRVLFSTQNRVHIQ
jgi:hypothetical protein